MPPWATRPARSPSPSGRAGWSRSTRCCSAVPWWAGRCGRPSSSAGPGWRPCWPVWVPAAVATARATWPPTRSSTSPGPPPAPGPRRSTRPGPPPEDGVVPIDADDLRTLLPELDDAPGPELTGAGTADGLRFTGLQLTGDATGTRFLECELADCDLAGVVFDRARLAGCLLAELRSPSWSLVDATLLDVVAVGGRFGALTAHGAELTRVALDGVKVDFLDLRGATLVDVALTGCTIGELDLSGADLRDVRLADCTVDSLVLAGARHRGVDLRGAAIGTLDGVADLRGCTISGEQLTGWAAGMAAELGIRVG